MQIKIIKKHNSHTVYKAQVVCTIKPSSYEGGKESRKLLIP